MEKLEVSDTTTKQSGNKKLKKTSQKIRLEKSYSKNKKFQKEFWKSKEKKEKKGKKGKKGKRNESDYVDDQASKYCTIYKVKGWSFWTNNVDDCYILNSFKKKKKHVTKGMIKKEFYDLIES